MSFDFEQLLMEDRTLSAQPSETVEWAIQLIANRGLTTVLDLACGNGRDTLALLAAGLQVTGVDLAKVAISRLQEIHPNIFLEADARQLPFANETFEAVYCFGLLHVFTKEIESQRRQVMSEIYRILKSKGIVVLTTLWTDQPGCGLPDMCCLSEADVTGLTQRLPWNLLHKSVIRDRSMTGWDSLHWRLALEKK